MSMSLLSTPVPRLLRNFAVSRTSSSADLAPLINSSRPLLNRSFQFPHPKQFHCTKRCKMWATKSTGDKADTSSPVPMRPERRNSQDEFQDLFKQIIANNKKWADTQRKDNAERMASLAKGQKPQILWIGCSDSRLPETTVLGLQPGEVFVHRNVANIVYPGDLSCAAVIEYAVNALEVKHIILCGHTGCGGIGAALGNKHIGLIDAWLMPLRNLRYRLHDELEKMDSDDRVYRMVKENVIQGVEVIRENPNVLKAQLDGNITVHGLIYDVGTGELEVVDTDVPDSELEKMRQAFKVE